LEQSPAFVYLGLDKLGGKKMTTKPKTTWKPHTKHGNLTERSDLPESVYAFPSHRKEPLTDAEHVQNALARFDQVKDVSDSERDQAFANILEAAKYYHVNVEEKSWHDLGKPSHTKHPRHSS
jgi:hypothetical protein